MRAGIVVTVTRTDRRRLEAIVADRSAPQKQPPGDATHWTGRMLAKAAGVSLRSVQRILEAHRLAPHRVRTGAAD